MFNLRSKSSKKDGIYSQKHYEFCKKKYIDLAEKVGQYKCIFVDSITVASRICLDFAKTHTDVINTKTGKPDIRAAYGLLATEMLTWVNQLQHLRGVDVILVVGLDQKLDDFGRIIYSPQIVGSKISAELPGILDEVITMVAVRGVRKFVRQTINQEGYPAKDRGGKLGVLEEAHLGNLLRKIKGQEAFADVGNITQEDKQRIGSHLNNDKHDDIKNVIKQIANLTKGEQKND
jgi:hypothetical protein